MISGVLSSCCGYLLSHSTRSRFQGWIRVHNREKKIEWKKESKEEWTWGSWRWNHHVWTHFCFYLVLFFFSTAPPSDWIWIINLMTSATPCPCLPSLLCFHGSEHTWGCGVHRWIFMIHDNCILLKELQSEVPFKKRKKGIKVMKRLFFPWANYLFFKLMVNILVLLYIFNSPFAFLQI